MTEEDLNQLAGDAEYRAAWKKKPLRIVSVSGGKDSTALYLWAKEQWGQDFQPVFADTNHEHPVTLNYLRNLPQMAGGPAIEWVRADFRDRIRSKFTDGFEDRSDSQKELIERNREFVSSHDYSSGNQFLDLMLWKGRAPSTKSQFCTEFLKLRPIREYMERVRGDAEVINYVGIRAAESARRAKMTASEDNEFFDCEVRRPLLLWSEEQVWAMLRKHEVPPNPLYDAGFSRVGCYPCIHARKSELARLEDWAWDKLAEWEQKLGRTWFPVGLVPGMHITTIAAARDWSKTSRGGREQDMFPPDAKDVPSCLSSWGACE